MQVLGVLTGDEREQGRCRAYPCYAGNLDSVPAEYRSPSQGPNPDDWIGPDCDNIYRGSPNPWINDRSGQPVEPAAANTQAEQPLRPEILAAIALGGLALLVLLILLI